MATPQEELAQGVQGENPSLIVPEVPETEVAQVEVTDETLQDPLESQAQAPEPLEAALGAATVVDPTIGEVEDVEPIEAVTVKEGAAAEAAEGIAIERDLERSELVSEQLAELTVGIESGNIPIWAQSAVAAVDRNLARRGLSRSSIGQAQLTNAILQTALPLAQANAQALQRRSEINLNNAQQTQLQNLSNRQQAAILTSQQQQQVLLSDQASENAALHFNAVSQQQTDQFNSQMRSSIEQNNAARLTTVEQFNAGQTNAINQFNGQMEAQVDQFNVANAVAIQQSNVNWRRQANTQNTASQNAAIMNDANNRFKLTSQDMANRWQSLRDLANWANQSTENNLDRVNKLAMGAMQADAAKDAAYSQAMGNVIGYGLGSSTGQAALESGQDLLKTGIKAGASSTMDYLFGSDGIGGEESGVVGEGVDFLSDLAGDAFDEVMSWFP